MMGPSFTPGRACVALCACVVLGGCSSWRGDESEVSTVGDPYVVTGFFPILGDYDAPFPAMTLGRSGSRPVTVPGLFDRKPLAEDFLKHQSLEEKRIAGRPELSTHGVSANQARASRRKPLPSAEAKGSAP